MAIASAGSRRVLFADVAGSPIRFFPGGGGSGSIRQNLGHSLRHFRLAQVAHDEDHHSQRHHQQQEPPLFPSGKVIASRTFGRIKAEQFQCRSAFPG